MSPHELIAKAITKLKEAQAEQNAGIAYRMYAEVSALSALATARFAEDRDSRERRGRV